MTQYESHKRRMERMISRAEKSERDRKIRELKDLKRVGKLWQVIADLWAVKVAMAEKEIKK